jgi:hypothetical protein
MDRPRLRHVRSQRALDVLQLPLPVHVGLGDNATSRTHAAMRGQIRPGRVLPITTATRALGSIGAHSIEY